MQCTQLKKHTMLTGSVCLALLLPSVSKQFQGKEQGPRRETKADPSQSTKHKIISFFL